jgi:hypothetical protein
MIYVTPSTVLFIVQSGGRSIEWNRASMQS